MGHEIDFTISDFAADLRAPTPSAAAELVVPSQAELGEKFNNVYSRLYSQANRIMERARLQLKAQTERPAFRNPMLKVNEERMYLDRLSQDFTTAYTGILNQKKQALQVGISRLDGLIRSVRETLAAQERDEIMNDAQWLRTSRAMWCVR